MRCLWIFVVLLLSFLSGGAFNAEAARFSGAYLLQVCEMDENGKETSVGAHATCQAYISGVIDYHNVLRSLNLAPEVDICIPEGETLNEIHDVVLIYLRAHGEHDGFVAAPAVMMALYDAYPCPR